MERLKLISEEPGVSQSNYMELEAQSSEQDRTSRRDRYATSFVGGPSSWDPYSKGIDPGVLKASLASRGALTPNKKREEPTLEKSFETKPDKPLADSNPAPSPNEAAGTGLQTNGEKTQKDAVKPKHKRKKKTSTNIDAS